MPRVCTTRSVALTGLARLAIPKDKPEEGRLLDGLRVTQESHKVNIHIDEPEELVDTVAEFVVGAGEIDRRPNLQIS